MIKEVVELKSPLDTLVYISKRLASFEAKYKMSSEEFYDKYTKGLAGDDIDATEWANDYRHYLEVRHSVEGQLRRVA